MTTDSIRRAAGSRATTFKAAGFILGAAFFFSGSPAHAQEPSCSVDKVNVSVNGFIPGVAAAAPGPQLVFNPDQGAGLGRETRQWLVERQCYLIANYGSQARTDSKGLLEFDPDMHEQADCEAFKRVVAANGGRSTVTRVIDRDVSQQARGNYWDVGMGAIIRPIASRNCR